MVLRSDEVANQAEVERDQRFRGNVAKGITSAGSLATAAVGGGLAARVLPFLNQYIPPGLAMKGINKVKKNNLLWVEEHLNAPTHANFFETRATDYAKGAKTGSWNQVWGKAS